MKLLTESELDKMLTNAYAEGRKDEREHIAASFDVPLTISGMVEDFSRAAAASIRESNKGASDGKVV